MYQTEHDELFASIRNGQPINNGEYMARSTLLAIMGRMAAYTGQEITWEMALNSKENLVPDRYDWNGAPPVAQDRRSRARRRLPDRRTEAWAEEITRRRSDAAQPSSDPRRSEPPRVAWPGGRGLCSGLARAAGPGDGPAPAGDEPQDPWQADPVPDRLHDAALFSVSAPARPDRHQGRPAISYVAWGTTHPDERGGETPVLAADAPADRAKELGKRCRDLGLEPLMMFSGIYPEDPEALKVLRQRILQAEAGGVPQVLTFGHTRGGNRKLWVERFKQLGPVARDHGVTIVVKQHGGETGTGAACAEIVREVDDAGIKVNYDAGNVMDYLDVDPIPDLRSLRRGGPQSFCIKDHRNTPRDEDCGPGFGEIDHYKLLGLVAFTGRTIPLCCENIFAPLLPRPSTPPRSTPWRAGRASSSRS